MEETILYKGSLVAANDMEMYETRMNALEFVSVSRGIVIPTTYFIQVGDNPASNIYVRNKIKKCEALGIPYKLNKFDESVTTTHIKSHIDLLNKSDEVSGIMIQLPLPDHIDEYVLKQAISPDKDIDGFHHSNVGRVMCEGIRPHKVTCATPLGITKLIDFYEIDLTGMHVVVIGRSDIVGRPIANILSCPPYNATVTLCHSKTQDLVFHTLNADVIITAVGKPNFLTRDMVSANSHIIDVGINRDEEGNLCGDVDFDSMIGHVIGITPVPGGVGITTVSALMHNIITCIEKCVLYKV